MTGRKKSRKSSILGARRKAKESSPTASLLHPTFVFLNANVLTMNADRPSAQAIAIVGEKILAVGSNSQIKALIGPETVVSDAKDATILPGFIDCHIHLIEYGLSLKNVDLRGVTSIEEMKKRVAHRAQSSAAWILGLGWDQERFTEKRYPTRKDLDEASPNKPVLLWRVCGHICVLNSGALNMAGINAKTPDPPGGIIDRDANGEPTGILRETAFDLVLKKIPKLSPDDYEEAIVAASQRALAAGLTTVHCITGSEPELRSLLRLRSDGRLRLRFYIFIPVEHMEAARYLGLQSGFGDEWVRLGGVKIFTDGSLGARTAALESPYTDDPRNSGVTIYDQKPLDEIIAKAHRSDLQIAAHAIGDRAVGMALHSFAKLGGSGPSNKLRHRIEHASVVTLNQLSQFRELGILASIQPHFTVSDFWVEQRLGKERLLLTYAFASLLKAGIRVVAGSDCPVEPLSPLLGVEAAVNRSGPEAVGVEDALAFYTRNAAYASYEENSKGTLSPGKLADLVVLDKDPRTVPPAMISKIRVLKTMVGGRIVHPLSSNA